MTETVRYGQVNKELLKSWLRLSPEEDGPFWAVNLMKYRDRADYADGGEGQITGREADDQYTPRESLRGVGAQIVFVADVESQLLGAEPQWDRVAVVRYPSGRAFVEMQSRPDFKEKHVHKEAGMQETIVMACKPMELPALPADAPAWADVPHPPTDEDPSVVVLHVLKFHDEGQSVDEMSSYTDHAARVAVPHGARLDGWFTVDCTIIGDGREWSQARFNAFPSKKAFMTVVLDPERLKAQRAHRETALQDTYTMILRPTINRLAESTGMGHARG
jgi:hypothetical protein